MYVHICVGVACVCVQMHTRMYKGMPLFHLSLMVSSFVQIIPYSTLLTELDISNVRELEVSCAKL